MMKYNFRLTVNFKRVEMPYEKSGSLEVTVWTARNGTVSTIPNLPNNLNGPVGLRLEKLRPY